MGSLDYSDAFDVLVSLWNEKKHPLNESKANIPTNEDITIGARIRPLLEKEIESGQAKGAIPREGHNIVDIHQLASGFPRSSQPILKVRSNLTN
jgi:hypothetical protein